MSRIIVELFCVRYIDSCANKLNLEIFSDSVNGSSFNSNTLDLLNVLKMSWTSPYRLTSICNFIWLNQRESLFSLYPVLYKHFFWSLHFELHFCTDGGLSFEVTIFAIHTLTSSSFSFRLHSAVFNLGCAFREILECSSLPSIVCKTGNRPWLPVCECLGRNLSWLP